MDQRQRSIALLDSLEAGGLIVDLPELNELADRVMKILYPEGKNVNLRIAKLPGENAFALPNGVVIMHLNLLASFDQVEQFAFVLAHEIAHISLNHGYVGAVSRRNGRLTAHLSDLLTMGTSSSQMRYVNLQSKRDRFQETIADQHAAIVLLEAGFDLEPSMVFFDSLQENDTSKNRSHPSHQSRVKRLNSLHSLGGAPSSDTTTLQDLFAKARRVALETSIQNNIMELDLEIAARQIRLLAIQAEECDACACFEGDVIHAMAELDAPFYLTQGEILIENSVISVLGENRQGTERESLLQLALDAYRRDSVNGTDRACALKGVGLVSRALGLHPESELYLRKYLSLFPDREDHHHIAVLLQSNPNAGLATDHSGVFAGGIDTRQVLETLR